MKGQKKSSQASPVGMDNYWLAVSLAKVEDIAVLPKMVKPISIDDLKSFFSKKAKWLMKK